MQGTEVQVRTLAKYRSTPDFQWGDPKRLCGRIVTNNHIDPALNPDPRRAIANAHARHPRQAPSSGVTESRIDLSLIYRTALYRIDQSSQGAERAL